MGESFIDPTDKDVEKALSYQKKRGLSEWSIEDYKTVFKKFYNWLGKSEEVAWIKRNRRPNYKVKPDFNISQTEIDLLVNACDNARDKAIITVLYDTGIRIGELLTLKLKDIVFDDAGMKLLVTGKTGTRQVRALGESVAFTRVWMNSHPDQFNEEAWLFCGIGHDMRAKSTIGEPMNHYLIYNMLSKVKNRAVKSGFPESKRIYPHKFRHNKASQLASKVREPILEKTMGWVPSSRMTSIYMHLNDDDVDSAIIEAHGLKPQKKAAEARKPRSCLYCKTPNPANSKYCLQCGRPLDVNEAKLLEERVTATSDELMKMNVLSDRDRNLLENLPEDSKIDVLTELLLDLERSGQIGDLRDRLRNKQR